MISVWIIEDNAAFRRATARSLIARGDLHVLEFHRCEDALTALRTGERPEVVLLDIGLPGIDGIEGIVQIKKIAADAGIIIFTVFEDDDKIFRAVCAGASGYLLKSEPMATVLRSIDQALAGGSPMNPRIAKRVLSMFAQIAPTGADSIPEEESGLSDRERRVLSLMVDGLGKKEIAARVDLNQHTVDYIIRCIYRKLHVNCIAAAVSRAVKDRIIT